MVINQKCSRVLSILLALFLILSVITPVSVFADYGEHYEKIATGNADSDVGNAIAFANKKAGFAKSENEDATDKLYVKVKGNPEVLAVHKEGTFEIDKDVWNDAKKDDVSKVMQLFVNNLSENGDVDAVNEFMGYFQEADSSISQIMLTMSFGTTKADLYQAYKIMKPFLDILNVILGIGCVLLILLLLFSTVMDLAYIGLPVWREAQSKDGKKNPFGVSFEALKTVEEIEKGLGGGDSGYRNAYLLYFKRRALTYIILAICVMYLICGGISGLIGFVLNLVGGIV